MSLAGLNRSLVAGVLFVSLVLARAHAVQAAALTGSITAPDGTPIAGAVVTFSGNGTPIVLRSDRRGVFSLASIPAGTFTVEATAKGYNEISGRTIQLLDGAPNDVALVMPRAQASSLATIGSVRTNGRQSLSTSPGQSQDIATAAYAARGVTRTSDILQNELSTTVQPVIGGGLNAPAVVSLRGPDPSETLVAIDGHAVNNGATGDFDLSLLDPADLQSVQVVYGIGPSSLFGPNTLGGALNVRTLEPTAQMHFLTRFTGGTFDTNGETVQATGTADRLGYALSYHRVTSGGELHNFSIPDSGTTVSNALDATSTIAKLRYSLFNGAGFVGVSLRDQSVFRDISATTSSYDVDADAYSSSAGSSMTVNNAAYSLDAQAPLGHPNHDGVYATTAIFRYQTSFAKQNVAGPAAGSSPYLFDDRDLIGDTTLELDHVVPHGSLSLKFDTTQENLQTGIVTGTSFADTDSIAALPAAFARRGLDDDSGGGGAVGLGGLALVTQEMLAQSQRSIGVRYTDDPTAKLHYSLATYYSDYSTFGRSTDPRFGFVWTPSGDTAVRFSAGTSFESPQLLSLVVPAPSTLYTPTNGYIAIGNPNLSAERATEYDAGYEHLFHVPGHALHLGLDLYRTNLRNGIASFIPSTPCAPNAAPVALAYAACLTYPINVAREVYEGLELHGDLQLAAYTTLHASYGENSVFSESSPLADNIVPGQQNIGVPLHKGRLTIERDPRGVGLGAYATILYEGNYNELNTGAYATLGAGLTMHTKHMDIGLSGTNLTNTNDFKLTRVNGGVPYGSLTSPSIATNAIPLAGTQFVLSIAEHI
jgi:outer membrane receptor protein involved in Fe transport